LEQVLTGLPNCLFTPWIISAVVIFQFKHLLADFILQTPWMAQGKEKPQGWLAPLTAHAGVHGVLTGAILGITAPGYAVLGIVDFAVHFSIDRAKGLLSREFDADTTNTSFWWLIGIDQTLHHLTHLVFAVLIAVEHTAP
jgi:hypothetical protein